MHTIDVGKLISTGELFYEITEQDDDASKIRRLLNYTQDENRDSKMDYNGHDDKIFKDSDCEESKDSDDVKPNDITGAKAYIETPGSRKLKGSSLYYGALYNHFCDLGGLRSIILICQDKDDEKRVSLNIVSDLVLLLRAWKLYRNERQKIILMEFREKLENRLEDVSA